MPGVGNGFPLKSSVPGLFKIAGVWTGGGAATDCSKSATDWSRGIDTVKYNAATGKYKVTFLECGQQLVNHICRIDGATGVTPVISVVVAGSFDPVAKTLSLETYAGAALIDLLVTNKLHLGFIFAKNAPP